MEPGTIFGLAYLTVAGLFLAWVAWSIDKTGKDPLTGQPVP